MFAHDRDAAIGHLDEISIAGDTHFWEVKRALPLPTPTRGWSRRLASIPSTPPTGLPVHHFSAVAGGSPADNIAYIIASSLSTQPPTLFGPYATTSSTPLRSSSCPASPRAGRRRRGRIDEMWALHAFTY